MELEKLLLGLIDNIRASESTSRDLTGMLSPLLGSFGPLGQQVRDVATGGGSFANYVGTVGNLVSGGSSGIGAALPLLGLLGLVGGGGAEQEAAPVRFELPETNRTELGFEAATGAIGRIDFGDRQTPRPAASGLMQAPQISIHVSALDSKSFLDRSDEIADAVRSAVLRSHSLSDALVED